MKMKTEQLSGLALDWAVAKCEGHAVAVLTVDEMRDRWMADVESRLRERELAEFERTILPTLSPRICVIGDGGFKRYPTHQEAPVRFNAGLPVFSYSVSWMQAGPIIEREGISITPTLEKPNSDSWTAVYGVFVCRGETPKVAAMRCYLIGQVGEEIDIPDELAFSAEGGAA